MTLSGKGMMIWKIPSCESGNATSIANVAQAAGFSHVLIKIADGVNSYNVNRTTNVDLVPPVVSALKAKGIQVWGWHYIYGSNPTGEATIAVNRTKALGLNGYVIDAESEFKVAGGATAATTYMNALRKGLPSTPIALCSYRYPSYHMQFPWKAFLDKCDYNMPQVYWQAAHNPDVQVTRSFKEFQALEPYRPYLATGPLYPVSDWSPSASELILFMDTCKSLNIPAVNYFTWDYKTKLSTQWNAIASYKWADSTEQDIVEKYISAMNSHNPDLCASMYASNAIRITASRIVQGYNLIRSWFNDFFTSAFPNAVFKLTGFTGTGSNRRFTWTATAPTGIVNNGNDTIGLVNGKIGYHYSFYSITK